MSNKRAKVRLPNASAAFTLVELLAVIAIIGILAAIAVPMFSKFQCRAKQSEAKAILKAIHVSQQTYRGENDCYAGGLGANDPGTLLIEQSMRGRRRYYFSIISHGANDYQNTYVASAIGLSNFQVHLDEWEINHGNNMSHLNNVCD